MRWALKSPFGRVRAAIGGALALLVCLIALTVLAMPAVDTSGRCAHGARAPHLPGRHQPAPPGRFAAPQIRAGAAPPHGRAP
jgi:hypothetical protein